MTVHWRPQRGTLTDVCTLSPQAHGYVAPIRVPSGDRAYLAGVWDYDREFEDQHTDLGEHPTPMAARRAVEARWVARTEVAR